jgi:hypothetical protein
MKVKRIVFTKMAGKDDDFKELAALAKRLGIPVKKPGKYIKFSSTAHEQTLTVFRQLADKLNYPMQTAITEAMDCWIEMRTPKK